MAEQIPVSRRSSAYDQPHVLRRIDWREAIALVL